MNFSTTGDLEDEEEEDEGDGLVHGRRKRKVAFLPSLGKYLDIFRTVEKNANCTLRYNPHHLLPWSLA